MSYIGKNPEADSVKLKGSATEPSGTAVDGQVYFNTGAGSISKGMKVYKNSQFVAIDKQLGDADTMQLLKAADVPAIDFSLSLTSTTVGGQGAVPFESSTGDFDGTAAFTNSSTGDALLTDDSADLVFHYTTQATNNANNDFWGIPLTVPRAFRGGNLVVEFKYRTEIATGTMDDGYFNIAIQDRSSMILQTQANGIAAGAIAAGANVLLTGKTYSNPVTGTTLTVAVGDRVFVESGTVTVGLQGNDIVDCYITSVSSTDNNVTLSKDIVAVKDGKFVTGWLTGYDTGGQISAFASDTNKDGTSKKLAFKTEADTQQVSLWFFVKGTSTVKHELFFDNVLLSGNKFLQASSQTKAESYSAARQASFWDASGTGEYEFNIALLLPIAGSPPLAESKLVEVVDESSKTLIKARQAITLSALATASLGSSAYIEILDKDDNVLARDQQFNSSNYESAVSATINLNKGDYVYFHSDNFHDRTGGVTFTVEPQASDVILLESQDEIFTDWVDYTPTLGGVTSTAANTKFAWRRVGNSMEIFGSFVSATVAASALYFTLPSGYQVDPSLFYAGDRTAVGVASREAAGIYAYEKGNTAVLFQQAGGANLDRIYFHSLSTGAAFVAVTGTGWMGTSEAASVRVWSVPIQGWNSNFNPLLSMPLVDFGTFENSYSAKISSTGVISSQTGNAIASVTPGTTGVYAVVFTSGFFTATPSIVGTAEDNNRSFGITVAPTTSGFTYTINVASTSTPSNASVNFTVNRQGSDYRDPPQSTAAVIKPSKAILEFQKAQNTEGGSVSAGAYNDITSNVWKGETWFVSAPNGTFGAGGTNTNFTLSPGTYRVFGRYASTYRTNYAKLRLYNVTDSVMQIQGLSNYASEGYNGVSFPAFMGVFTITAAKAFKVQLYASRNTGGTSLGLPVNISGETEIYCFTEIEKLK